MADDTTNPTTPTGTEPGQQTDKGEKTFTQADLNKLIDERLTRERAKYADYADLKKAADQWKQHEDAQKTEVEKLQAQIADWQNRATQADQRRQTAILRSSVMAEAGKQGVPADRIEAAYKLLDTSKLSVDESDAVSGLEDAIKALLQANTFLLAATTPNKLPVPRTSPTNPASDAPISDPVMEQVQARLQGRGQTFGRGGVIWNKGSEG